jgi:antirestriction protein ArdC
MEKLTREQYRERAAAKVAAAQEVLAAEVGALVTGADWQEFLDFQATLHDYSANNVMLIFAQHARAYEEGRVPEPTPTYIAGFETWRALGRSVERGQHGYAVLAPMRSTRRQARDAEGNVRALGRGDRPSLGETETRTPVLRGFTVATVFDASQTSGKNLPDPPRPRLLAGEAPRGLGAAVKELIESKGFAVDTVTDAGYLQGANGQTNWSTQVVLIRADMDDAAMVKTLIHEAAHVLLHQTPPASHLPRATKEVEAESVAYVVASVHGMPTDEYSFPYVAGWAGEDADKAIRQTQARVNAGAQAIISASPAEHMGGAKLPGTDLAVAQMRQLEGEVADAHLDGLHVPH